MPRMISNKDTSCDRLLVDREKSMNFISMRCASCDNQRKHRSAAADRATRNLRLRGGGGLQRNRRASSDGELAQQQENHHHQQQRGAREVCLFHEGLDVDQLARYRRRQTKPVTKDHLGYAAEREQRGRRRRQQGSTDQKNSDEEEDGNDKRRLVTEYRLRFHAADSIENLFENEHSTRVKCKPISSRYCTTEARLCATRATSPPRPSTRDSCRTWASIARSCVVGARRCAWRATSSARGIRRSATGPRRRRTGSPLPPAVDPRPSGYPRICGSRATCRRPRRATTSMCPLSASRGRSCCVRRRSSDSRARIVGRQSTATFLKSIIF
ncbi:unnamed protein product [Trichogramma brassicae]|uniref:Uncharacterized protein n=1 Tax=Trichogramma brassicae TaxID=86971 RepID=A0A6H5IJU4_9HYME|nr:unnamed protein product [Trichogramma brassicae]